METLTLPEQYQSKSRQLRATRFASLPFGYGTPSTPKPKLPSMGWADGLLEQKGARRLEPKQV